MPKFLKNEENVAELAQRLIAELTATHLKKDGCDGLAEFARPETTTGNSGIKPPRLTQLSSAQGI